MFPTPLNISLATKCERNDDTKSDATATNDNINVRLINDKPEGNPGKIEPLIVSSTTINVEIFTDVKKRYTKKTSYIKNLEGLFISNEKVSRGLSSILPKSSMNSIFSV